MLSPRMPDLSALEMLLAVRDTGSFSAAGKQMGLSQQAVSSRMRSLENLVGTPLIVRTPRGSSLTEAGILVGGWAADVLATAERLDAGIASLRGDQARQLKVAASQTIAEHLLPQWLVTLRRQQRTLGAEPSTIEMTVGNSVTTIELVRSGAAALGFVETPTIPKDLHTRVVQQDELVVVTSPQHPWAKRRSLLTLDELSSTSLVTREHGSGTRDALEQLLADAGFRRLAEPIVEFGTTAAVRSAIAAGSAPGVLSALAVRDDLALQRLVVIPLAGPTLTRNLTAIWAHGSTAPQGPARDLLAIASRVV